MPIEPSDFRRVLGSFASGVTVVTTVPADGRPVGITVSSFASVSLTPALVSYNLDIEAQRYHAFADADRYAINILASDQDGVSSRFARLTAADPFAEVAWIAGPDGVPLITGALGWIACRRWACYPGGDHAILVGRVEALDCSEGAPLLYFRGRYGDFAKR
jgi:3-hydroxy-9,10-secoandrosta-1,3,5(10)-triene-9,17-dione monooxygenase reductase component